MSTSPHPNPSQKPEARSRRKRHRVIFCVCAGIILSLATALTVYAFTYESRIMPHTKIAGVPVGGLTRDQADLRLKAHESTLRTSTLILTYKGKQWSVQPEKLGSTLNYTPALNQAWVYGRQGTTLQQLAWRLRAVVQQRDYPMSLNALSNDGRQYLQTNVLSGIEQPVSETTLKFLPGNVQVLPGTAGARLDETAFAAALSTALANGGSVPLKLEPFQPQVTPAQAESARQAAGVLLASNWKVTAGSQSLELTPSDIAGWLGTAVAKDASGAPTGLSLTLKTDTLKQRLSDWGNAINQDPLNLHLKVDNGTLSVDDQGSNGQQFNLDKTLAAVQSAFLGSQSANRTIGAVIDTITPPVQASNLAQLGITQLIGTATTDFVGSPVNRVWNIGVGQTKLNRVLVNDGASFSTIALLTPIDQAHNYKPELVIKGNKTVPEDGGGLCQVSTTLFRAVLNAGLLVTERANHAYRVPYYERGVGPGLDATVYDPQPDFRWKNDTGHAVFVQSAITGTKLTFDIYGTSDGRTVSISAPNILSESPPPPDVYSVDATLASGAKKQVDHAHPGAVTEVTYSVTRAGKEINHQVFKSTYKPWPNQFLVAADVSLPGATPSPAPSPTPSPTAAPTPAP